MSEWCSQHGQPPGWQMLRDGLRLEIGYASAGASETRGREASGISTLQRAPIRPRLGLAVPVRRAYRRGKIQIPAEDRWKMQKEAERPLKRAEDACVSAYLQAPGGAMVPRSAHIEALELLDQRVAIGLVLIDRVHLCRTHSRYTMRDPPRERGSVQLCPLSQAARPRGGLSRRQEPYLVSRVQCPNMPASMSSALRASPTRKLR